MGYTFSPLPSPLPTSVPPSTTPAVLTPERRILLIRIGVICASLLALCGAATGLYFAFRSPSTPTSTDAHDPAPHTNGTHPLLPFAIPFVSTFIKRQPRAVVVGTAVAISVVLLAILAAVVYGVYLARSTQPPMAKPVPVKKDTAWEAYGIVIGIVAVVFMAVLIAIGVGLSVLNKSLDKPVNPPADPVNDNTKPELKPESKDPQNSALFKEYSELLDDLDVLTEACKKPFPKLFLNMPDIVGIPTNVEVQYLNLGTKATVPFYKENNMLTNTAYLWLKSLVADKPILLRSDLKFGLCDAKDLVLVSLNPGQIVRIFPRTDLAKSIRELRLIIDFLTQFKITLKSLFNIK